MQTSAAIKYRETERKIVRNLEELIKVKLTKHLSLTDSLIVFRWYIAQPNGYSKMILISPLTQPVIMTDTRDANNY